MDEAYPGFHERRPAIRWAVFLTGLEGPRDAARGEQLPAPHLAHLIELLLRVDREDDRAGRVPSAGSTS